MTRTKLMLQSQVSNYSPIQDETWDTPDYLPYSMQLAGDLHHLKIHKLLKEALFVQDTNPISILILKSYKGTCVLLFLRQQTRQPEFNNEWPNVFEKFLPAFLNFFQVF